MGSCDTALARPERERIDDDPALLRAVQALSDPALEAASLLIDDPVNRLHRPLIVTELERRMSETIVLSSGEVRYPAHQTYILDPTRTGLGNTDAFGSGDDTSHMAEFVTEAESLRVTDKASLKVLCAPGIDPASLRFTYAPARCGGGSVPRPLGVSDGRIAISADKGARMLITEWQQPGSLFVRKYVWVVTRSEDAIEKENGK